MTITLAARHRDPGAERSGADSALANDGSIAAIRRGRRPLSNGVEPIVMPDRYRALVRRTCVVNLRHAHGPTDGRRAPIDATRGFRSIVGTSGVLSENGIYVNSGLT